VDEVIEGGQRVGGGGGSEAGYSGFERAIGGDFEGESDVGALGGVEQEADGAEQRMRDGAGEEAGGGGGWAGGGGGGGGGRGRPLESVVGQDFNACKLGRNRQSLSALLDNAHTPLLSQAVHAALTWCSHCA
jgi:hypothetical protein